MIGSAKRVYLLVFLNLISTFYIWSADWFALNIFQQNDPVYYFGLEYAELMQNPDVFINRENWTATMGFNNFRKTPGIGLSYLGFSAELGDEHLQNPQEVAFIEGPRDTISGDVSAHRLWIDWTPVSIHLFPNIYFPQDDQMSLLKIVPVLMAGPGWNSWGFYEKSGSESYRLDALTFSVGLRLRTTIGGVIFIENPLFDAFLYIWKSRSAAGTVGSVSITRPEEFGLFSWAAIGIEVSGIVRIIRNLKER